MRRYNTRDGSVQIVIVKDVIKICPKRLHISDHNKAGTLLESQDLPLKKSTWTALSLWDRSAVIEVPPCGKNLTNYWRSHRHRLHLLPYLHVHLHPLSLWWVVVWLRGRQCVPVHGSLVRHDHNTLNQEYATPTCTRRAHAHVYNGESSIINLQCHNRDDCCLWTHNARKKFIIISSLCHTKDNHACK